MKNLFLSIVIGICLMGCFSSCDRVSKRKTRSLKSDSLVGNLASSSLTMDSVYTSAPENAPTGPDSVKVFGALRPKYKTK